eukprot:CAMPEP_0197250746 /NCGR_PEP_ID=MMETSP1429-20130617/54218_1 /TAXON_ID=49237 /ORGANISM="Chaetoceros  sp., Strain UNC1202" /LENGTH=96 /DNA_ID=CAMNT_0042712659 /DNA_START=483 /DNA_END=771 /DNA_ORIENTATION=+
MTINPVDGRRLQQLAAVEANIREIQQAHEVNIIQQQQQQQRLALVRQLQQQNVGLELRKVRLMEAASRAALISGYIGAEETTSRAFVDLLCATLKY